MKIMTNASEEPSTCADQQLVAQFRKTLRMLTGKWKGEILWLLVQRKLRFGELRRSIPGITQHMLTTQLRELEADGLVERTAYAEIPPRVEYAITPAAAALRPVFDALLQWSTTHGPASLNQHGASPERSHSLQPMAD